MRFLKEKKGIIISFIIGVILASGIVYAATSAGQVSYTTNKNGEVKTVEDALNDLYNKKSKTLLWTNPNPNSAFSSQDITLSSSIANYTHILVKWKNLKSSETIFDDIFKLSPERCAQAESARFYIGAMANTTNQAYARGFDTIQNDNLKIHFGSSAEVGGTIVNNDRNIPIEIYGLSFSY